MQLVPHMRGCPRRSLPWNYARPARMSARTNADSRCMSCTPSPRNCCAMTFAD